jgi:hypothetical protein
LPTELVAGAEGDSGSPVGVSWSGGPRTRPAPGRRADGIAGAVRRPEHGRYGDGDQEESSGRGTCHGDVGRVVIKLSIVERDQAS